MVTLFRSVLLLLLLSLLLLQPYEGIEACSLLSVPLRIYGDNCEEKLKRKKYVEYAGKTIFAAFSKTKKYLEIVYEDWNDDV